MDGEKRDCLSTCEHELIIGTSIASYIVLIAVAYDY